MPPLRGSYYNVDHFSTIMTPLRGSSQILGLPLFYNHAAATRLNAIIGFASFLQSCRRYAAQRNYWVCLFSTIVPTLRGSNYWDCLFSTIMPSLRGSNCRVDHFSTIMPPLRGSTQLLELSLFYNHAAATRLNPISGVASINIVSVTSIKVEKKFDPQFFSNNFSQVLMIFCRSFSRAFTSAKLVKLASRRPSA